VERTVTASLPVSPPALPVAPHLRGVAGRLLPLWRHAVWAAATFILLASWVEVRVGVQQLRKDLDRSGRTHREATVLNDRLRLEVDARRRAVAMEAAAAQLSLASQAPFVDVTLDR